MDIIGIYIKKMKMHFKKIIVLNLNVSNVFTCIMSSMLFSFLKDYDKAIITKMHF